MWWQNFIVLVLLVGLAVGFFFHWRTRQFSRVFNGGNSVPSTIPKPQLFQLGHFKRIISQGALETLQDFSKLSNSACFLYWCGMTPHVVPTDPDCIKQVLMNKDGTFTRNTELSQALFRKGLIAIEGGLWKQHRKIINPAFQHLAIKQAFPIIQESVCHMTQQWHEKSSGPFSPIRDFSALMLEILGKVAFDYDFRGMHQTHKSFHKTLVVLTVELMRRYFSPISYWHFYQSKAVETAWVNVKIILTDVIEQAEEKRQNNKLPNTIIKLLLDSKANNTLTENEVFDEVFNFFIAGHETSATALTWLVAMLAEHQEVQQKVMREVEQIDGDNFSYDDLEKLDYLTMVIQETMRLYPPVPTSVYVANETTQLGEHTIPKNTRIDVLSYLTHRDGRYWENPEAFIPERFEKEQSKQQHSHQYFPFLLGKHTCIGLHLAMMELKIAAVYLLKSFHIEPLIGQCETDLRVSLHPSGFKISIKAREALKQ